MITWGKGAAKGVTNAVLVEVYVFVVVWGAVIGWRYVGR